MKKGTLFIATIFIGILFLTGCGNKLSKYTGTYSLSYTRFIGDPVDEKNIEKSGGIILSADGMGKMNRDGKTYNLEWVVDGDNITIYEKYGPLTNVYDGTIIDGRITIYNGDKDNPLTMQSVYEKQ